jgi:DNA-binding NarL/FixJ family response regulator
MKIFIVDDSAAIRERLRDMLERIPDVEFTGDADNENEALQKISRFPPDVVILDFSSAKGNSLSLMYRIKLQSVETRVIVLTNNVYPQYRKKCMEEGADYFMDKSRDIDELARILSELANESKAALRRA